MPRFCIPLIFAALCHFSVHADELRIISLAPHITELLFEVGAGDKVVGTVEFANYPDAAKSIPRIGDYNSVRIESVIQLNPTFVVAQPGTAIEPYLAKLKKLGMDVRYSHPETALQVAEHLEKLGKWVGNETLGKARAEVFLKQWQQLKSEYQNPSHQPRVFFQAWLNPLMTLNKNNLIHEVIEICGGRNVFAELPMPVPQIGVEAVMQANPEVIIYSGQSPENDTQTFWSEWVGISAVKHQRIYWVHADDLARPVPGILKGARKVCESIHDKSAAAAL